MAFIAAKKGEVAEGAGVGEGGVVGAGVGPWKLIHGALGHTTDTGRVGGEVGGGHGPGMAMGGGEREGSGLQPGASEGGWWVGGWAASLVAEDGRNQLEGVEWRHWRHGHMADGLDPRSGMWELGSREGTNPGLQALNLRIGVIPGALEVLQFPPLSKTENKPGRS